MATKATSAAAKEAPAKKTAAKKVVAKKAVKPVDNNALAVETYKKSGGGWTTHAKMPVNTLAELAVAYTPGIAEPCRRIKVDPDLSYVDLVW